MKRAIVGPSEGCSSRAGGSYQAQPSPVWADAVRGALVSVKSNVEGIPACIPVWSRRKTEGHRLRVKEWPGKDKIPPPGVGPRGWAGLARVGRGSCFAREAYPGLNRKVMWRRKPGPSKSFLVYDR